jgi:hypothetical protein
MPCTANLVDWQIGQQNPNSVAVLSLVLLSAAKVSAAVLAALVLQMRLRWLAARRFSESLQKNLKERSSNTETARAIVLLPVPWCSQYSSTRRCSPGMGAQHG